MKGCLLFFLLLFSFPDVFGQDKLWEEKQTILSDYYKLKRTDSLFTYEIVSRKNMVSVEIKGTDSLKLIHHFNLNGPSNPESLCDSMEIYLECAKCVDQTLLKIISDRERKWIQLTDGSYISRKYVMWSQANKGAKKIYTIPVMQIFREQNESKVIIFTINLSKADWKERLK
jgi:hypothetical protein